MHRHHPRVNALGFCRAAWHQDDHPPPERFVVHLLARVARVALSTATLGSWDVARSAETFSAAS